MTRRIIFKLNFTNYIIVDGTEIGTYTTTQAVSSWLRSSPQEFSPPKAVIISNEMREVCQNSSSRYDSTKFIGNTSKKYKKNSDSNDKRKFFN